MAFDQSSITAGPACEQLPSNELRISWTSIAPAGTTFQLYFNTQLAWSGEETHAYFPIPIDPIRIWVGTVGAGEGDTDFSDDLTDPLGSGNVATLTWHGGLYLGLGLAGFNIYQGASPLGFGDGGFGAGQFGSSALVPVDFVGPTAAIWRDGFGRGRFGEGGFGHAEVDFIWTSGPLTTGTWAFSIVPVDAAGNEGTPRTTTVTIAAPPNPPAGLGPGLGRLSYLYDATTSTVTLEWNPSPP